MASVVDANYHTINEPAVGYYTNASRVLDVRVKPAFIHKTAVVNSTNGARINYGIISGADRPAID